MNELIGLPIMTKEEVVENLKTMIFGKQAFERFNAKEIETLDRAITLIEEKAELKGE